jgi:hypothetical protein
MDLVTGLEIVKDLHDEDRDQQNPSNRDFVGRRHDSSMILPVAGVVKHYCRDPDRRSNQHFLPKQICQSRRVA